MRAQASMETIAGAAFNIGGGPSRTTSLVELVDIINGLNGGRMSLEYDAWREADQRYYVSDTTKFRDATGWTPRTSVADGVRALYEWLVATRHAPAPASAALAS
jgi:CDP-paratose 2-epimerase